MISDKVLYLAFIPRLLGDTPSLAIGVHFYYDETDGRTLVRYHDTVRGHQFPGYLLEETEDGFIWRVHREVEWGRVEEFDITFKLFTLAMFKGEYSYLIQGKTPEFSTDEDLWEYYRRRYKGAGVIV